MTHPTDALSLVPRRATPQQLEAAAFNLSAEIGAEEAMKLGPHIELAYELLVAAASASPLDIKTGLYQGSNGPCCTEVKVCTGPLDMTEGSGAYPPGPFECRTCDRSGASPLSGISQKSALESIEAPASPLPEGGGQLSKNLGQLKSGQCSGITGELSGWQDISTAPKDGTVIDAWRKEGGRETVFWGYPHHECGEMGGLCDSDWHSIRSEGWVCNYFNEFLGRSHNPFTHWMPLPAAPTGDAK